VRAQASRHFQRLQRSRSSGCSTIFFNLFLTLAFLGLQAFKNVLVKKQSKYGKVITWLDEKIAELRAKNSEGLSRMSGIVSSNPV
jgi:hypothetical protein